MEMDSFCMYPIGVLSLQNVLKSHLQDFFLQPDQLTCPGPLCILRESRYWFQEALISQRQSSATLKVIGGNYVLALRLVFKCQIYAKPEVFAIFFVNPSIHTVCKSTH